MGQNIYGSMTPALSNESDGPITLGTMFQANVDGYMNGVRHYAPVTFESGRQGIAWRWDSDTNGRFLRVVNLPTGTNNAWNYTAFDVPVQIKSGQRYVTGIYMPAHYVATGGLFQSGPIVSGNLTAPANGAGSANGKFHAGGGFYIYPEQNFNGGGYFADLDFTVNSISGQKGHTSQTPGSQNNDANSPRVLGVDFQVNTPGTIDALRFWVGGASLPAVIEVALYDPSVSTTVPMSSGLLVPSVTGWMDVPLAVPQSVSASHTYTAAVRVPLNVDGIMPDYVFTTNGLSSNIVNGNVTLLNNTGRFLNNSGATMVYPTGLSTSDLFVDVSFTAGGAPTPNPRIWGIRR